MSNLKLDCLTAPDVSNCGLMASGWFNVVRDKTPSAHDTVHNLCRCERTETDLRFVGLSFSGAHQDGSEEAAPQGCQRRSLRKPAGRRRHTGGRSLGRPRLQRNEMLTFAKLHQDEHTFLYFSTPEAARCSKASLSLFINFSINN